MAGDALELLKYLGDHRFRGRKNTIIELDGNYSFRCPLLQKGLINRKDKKVKRLFKRTTMFVCTYMFSSQRKKLVVVLFLGYLERALNEILSHINKNALSQGVNLD